MEIKQQNNPESQEPVRVPFTPFRYHGITEAVFALICAAIGIGFAPAIFGSLGILLGIRSVMKGSRNWGLIAILVSIVCMVTGLLPTLYDMKDSDVFIWSLFFTTICFPVILWFLFIGRMDAREPEPKLQYFKAFVLGAAVGIIASLVEVYITMILIPGQKAATLTEIIEHLKATNIFLVPLMMLIVGIVEELLKYSVVREFFFERREFNQMADGMYYAFVVALGFATLENIGYFQDVAVHHNSGALLITALFRSLVSLLLHLSATGIMGYALGRYKFGATPNVWRLRIMIGLAIILHGVFNLLLVFLFGIFIAIPLTIVCFITVVRLSRTDEENIVWKYVESKG